MKFAATSFALHRGRMEGHRMFNKVRRHFNRVHNVRELRSLDPRLCNDIGSLCEHRDPSLRRILLLPLGPGDRTRS